MTKPSELDAVDRALIRGLQADGRVSYTDLGRQVGLSAPAVRDRVQRMIEAGILQIAAVTDPLALGLPVMALIGIRVNGDAVEVTDAIRAIENVIYLVGTAGSFDLFAEVVCHTMDELFEVINDRVRPIPGVASVESFPYFGIHVHRFTWDVPD